MLLTVCYSIHSCSFVALASNQYPLFMLIPFKGSKYKQAFLYCVRKKDFNTLGTSSMRRENVGEHGLSCGITLIKG